jgi:hypothetical protein
MRLIKMLGIAALTALTAMALVGASSAMASESTQLCKVDRDVGGKTETCASPVTHVHFTDPLALLHAESFGLLVDILCEALFLSATAPNGVLGLGTAPLPQVIHGSFTYSGPHGVGGPCINMKSGGGTENCQSVKEVGTPGGLLSVLREGLELATVTGTEFEVLVECAGLHCIYKAEGLKGHALGPLLFKPETNGNVTITNQPVQKVSGFLCPTTSNLTTTQVPLEKIYLAK